MALQWHPLFARLLSKVLGDAFSVETEKPVGELPRRADRFVIRRQDVPSPFVGLWANLADWNVVEFKSPADVAKEIDLDLLAHVGSGHWLRLGEERAAAGLPRLERSQVAWWYLAPRLDEVFLQPLHGRTQGMAYQAEGLYRGRLLGHPLLAFAYNDAGIEADTLPIGCCGEIINARTNWCACSPSRPSYAGSYSVGCIRWNRTFGSGYCSWKIQRASR